MNICINLHQEVGQLIGQWERLNDEYSQLSQLNIQENSLKEDLRHRIGYWDSFVNIFPQMISSTLASDYQTLESYNQLVNKISLNQLGLNQIQRNRDGVISEICRKIINWNSVQDVEVRFYLNLENQLKGLLNHAFETQHQLSKAITSEFYDGRQTNSSALNYYVDACSRNDNMTAAGFIRELNERVSEFNTFLSAYPLGFELPRLKKLYNADNALISSELNESNIPCGPCGDTWASNATYLLLIDIQRDLDYLIVDLRAFQSSIAEKLAKKVEDTLRQEFPELTAQSVMQLSRH